MDLTAAERVLLHLHDFWNAREPIREATQEGIAAGTGVLRSHVPRALQALVAHGEIAESSGRIRGRGRKVKLYRLTEPGMRRARTLLDDVLERVVMTDAGRSTVRKVAEAHGLRTAEVVACVGTDDTFLRPAPPTDARAGLVGREAELGVVRAWYAGPCPVLVVYGARGIGKTALVHEFLRGTGVKASWVDLAPEGNPPPTPPEEALARRGLFVVDGYAEASEATVEWLSALVAAASRRPPGRLVVVCQDSTPSYCRFHSRREIEAGVVREVRLRGLSLEAVKTLLGRSDLDAEAVQRVYLLTKGCPTCITRIRAGDADGLRQHARFTRAEIELLLFSAGSRREAAALTAG